MNDPRLRFRAAQVDYARSTRILAFVPEDMSFTAGPFRLVVLPQPMEPAEPPSDSSVAATLDLSSESARSLMDALWESGHRPSHLKNEPSAEVIRRIEQHLGDMRAIAFKKIGVDKP